MTQQDNGGAAFPRTVQQWNGNLQAFDGMTLRDWFAGQALTSMLSQPSDISDGTPALAARLSYKFADAMIAARKVQP